jgi:hypothetical protein
MAIRTVSDTINNELSFRIGRIVGNCRILTKAAESLEDQHMIRVIKEIKQKTFTLQSYARKNYGIDIGAKEAD